MKHLLCPAIFCVTQICFGQDPNYPTPAQINQEEINCVVYNNCYDVSIKYSWIGYMNNALATWNKTDSSEAAYSGSLFEEYSDVSLLKRTRAKNAILEQTKVADSKKHGKNYYIPQEINIAADPILAYMAKPELEKVMKNTQKKMEAAAKDLDFIEAARLRDEYLALKKLFDKK